MEIWKAHNSDFPSAVWSHYRRKGYVFYKKKCQLKYEDRKTQENKKKENYEKKIRE